MQSFRPPSSPRLFSSPNASPPISPHTGHTVTCRQAHPLDLDPRHHAPSQPQLLDTTPPPSSTPRPLTRSIIRPPTASHCSRPTDELQSTDTSTRTTTRWCDGDGAYRGALGPRNSKSACQALILLLRANERTTLIVSDSSKSDDQMTLAQQKSPLCPAQDPHDRCGWDGSRPLVWRRPLAARVRRPPCLELAVAVVVHHKTQRRRPLRHAYDKPREESKQRNQPVKTMLKIPRDTSTSLEFPESWEELGTCVHQKRGQRAVQVSSDARPSQPTTNEPYRQLNHHATNLFRITTSREKHQAAGGKHRRHFLLSRNDSPKDPGRPAKEARDNPDQPTVTRPELTSTHPKM
ncbi:hypothetical protein CCHR01_19692 [Colletotrichum chrysophilum]|uniref:Uncharacterized protein n=1 Tax=Colletotrichum chrysophilum TaxID=1836956 RepID=A0AAD8ZXV1_9PEZI|nr:hypothetical protein CCHR01_19692 [Colletotrichum chrysophilum]